MRAFLLLLAITVAVALSAVGDLDHTSDCFICRRVLVAALWAPGASSYEERFDRACNHYKSFVKKRPICNQIASEFLASSCLRDKFKGRSTLDVREALSITHL
ncbi:hypothetical protein ANCCAN_26546 [Ancylostoma caninum]|uniref:Saposin B-type domain-containing protein n=1 Tax=Ancylostoma caninum TaxID=29170 RepID=A0A368F820_ANCCA|nr:hypothetical protein ANCCAN_26546 [Ancylostoma caninum]